MAFQLYSCGRLKEGCDQQQALVMLERIMQLPQEKIRIQLLSGARRRLATLDDPLQAEKLRKTLLEAGLEVEVIEEGDTSSAASDADSGLASVTASRHTQHSPTRHRLIKTIFALAGAVLLLLGGILSYGWYWLNHPLSDDAQAAEQALSDGTLVAIAYADIDRITFLKKHWFGEADPAALPDSIAQQQLWQNLFSGNADFQNNLHQAFVAVHRNSEKSVVGSLLLIGQFEEKAILDALQQSFRTDPLGSGRWALLARPENSADISCPEPEAGTANREAKPYYLQLTPQYFLLSNDEERLSTIAQRLESSSAATQDLKSWRSYRSGQLLSVMALIPDEASMALDGMPGMLARKASKETPQISNIAARIGVAPLNRGLHADLRITSQDPQWNTQKGEALRQGLDEWLAKGNAISAALGRLLSRITVESTAESLQVNVTLDAAMLGELSATLEEAFSQLFFVQMKTPADRSGPVADELIRSPYDYTTVQSLAQLPAYEANKFAQRPLFIDGSFAVDATSVRRNNEGLYELLISGEVALPKSEKMQSRRPGYVRLSIDDVTNAEGQSLLRDEHCLKQGPLGKPNHEAAESDFLFADRASINKQLRLRKGVMPEEIAQIKGQISFTAPVEVKRLELPRLAGSKVETNGVRIYINSIGDDGRVSYQLSGAKQRLLEMRAINKDGQPLASDWSMGSQESGRLTRHFKGTIKSLELYIAERFVEHKKSFTLQDIFRASQSEPGNDVTPRIAPLSSSIKEWQEYTALNLRLLHADPKDKEWHRFKRQDEPVASMMQKAVTFDLYHRLTDWGNHPEADLYYPMLPAFPVTLSAISYRIDEPAGEKSGVLRYVHASYPYYPNNGEYVIQHHIADKPFARQPVTLITGLQANEQLQRLRGVFQFRLPLQMISHHLPLHELWQGKNIDGVEVDIAALERGTFPGYKLRIRGDLTHLVALYGLTADNERVAPNPVNFQDDGYWTMTVPYDPAMKQLELVMASEQKLYEVPFDLKPVYKPSAN